MRRCCCALSRNRSVSAREPRFHALFADHRAHDGEDAHGRPERMEQTLRQLGGEVRARQIEVAAASGPGVHLGRVARDPLTLCAQPGVQHGLRLRQKSSLGGTQAITDRCGNARRRRWLGGLEQRQVLCKEILSAGEQSLGADERVESVIEVVHVAGREHRETEGGRDVLDQVKDLLLLVRRLMYLDRRAKLAPQRYQPRHHTGKGRGVDRRDLYRCHDPSLPHLVGDANRSRRRAAPGDGALPRVPVVRQSPASAASATSATAAVAAPTRSHGRGPPSFRGR